VAVATGRIRRGPTHLDGERGAEQAAALVRDIRKSAQEKFYTIAVDADGKILNLHKYSKSTKDSTPANAIEAAGFAANIPGVKKVYTVHNHPGGTARASVPDSVQAHRLDSIFKLNDIESEHLIVAGNKYLNYTAAPGQPKALGSVPKERRIFETKRHLKGPDPAERSFTDLGDAAQWVRINHPGKAGLILTDSQNRPLDFFEYPKGTTQKKATAELVKRMESANAGNLVAVTPRLTRRQEGFFKKVGKAVSMDATLEDIIELKKGGGFRSQRQDKIYKPPKKPRTAADALSRSFDDLNTSKLLMHPGAVGGAAGFLGGFEADEDGGIRYNPAKGLKYAVYGAGAGFGLNKGVRAFQARRAGKPPSKVRQAVTSGVTNFREALEDDWRRVRLLTRQKDVALTEANDMYAAETRYRGRLSARMEEAERIVDDIDRSVLTASKKYGMVDAEFYDDVSKYLVGKHVPERNAKHGARAARYSDEEAAGMVADVMQKPHFEDVRAIAGKIAALNRNTIDTLRDAGVITKKLHTLLRTDYKNHVPLNRVLNNEDDVVQALSSRGLDVRGSGLKRAKGSDLDIDDILANVVSNYKAALVRAEKNILDRHTLNFARDNAHLELFEEIPANRFFIGTRPKKQGGGPIFRDVKDDPHILQMMENGKPVYLKIRDTRLAAALKGVNRKQMGVVTRASGMVTRLMASLATRYNPEFALSNKIRDIQEMLVYVASESDQGMRTAGRAASREAQALSNLWKDVRDGLRGKDTEGARLYRQMKMDGGTTGGLALSTRREIKVDLEKLKSANRSVRRRALRGVVRSVDKWNTIFEDSTRLSVYKQALADGHSRKRAAALAKESTINFDKMGTMGPAVNALYMFSNASIRGSMKMLRAMKNPKVLGTVALTMGAGVFGANNYNEQKDPEWHEKVSPWDRLNSLVIVTSDPGEDFSHIAIPVSWGLKPIKVLMDQVYDAHKGLNDNPADMARKVAVAFMEGYNPAGGTDILQAAMPTVFDPFVDAGRNKAWHGGRIGRESPSRAESIKYFDSLKEQATGRLAIAGTKKLAETTGVEVNPADVVYVIDQLTSGAGRSLRKATNTLAAVTRGEKPLARDIPFASRFYRSIPEDEIYRRSKDAKTLDRMIIGQEKARFYRDEDVRALVKQMEQGGDPHGQFERIARANPELAKRIIRVKRGTELTSDERKIMRLGVKDGNRALFLVDKFNAMETQAEKHQYFNEMVKKKIITDEVYGQIIYLLNLQRGGK